MMKRPEDMLRAVMLSDPRGSQKEHRDTLFKQMTPALLEVVFDQWFAGRYPHRVIISEGGRTTVVCGGPVKGPAKSGWSPKREAAGIIQRRQEREAKERRERLAAERAAAAFKQRILLDFILPDGTMLRDATKAKCRQAGGWLSALAKKKWTGGVVGTSFTNTELHNVWQQVK